MCLHYGQTLNRNERALGAKFIDIFLSITRTSIASLSELIEMFIAARLWEKFPGYNLKRAPLFDENNRIRTNVDIFLSTTDVAMAGDLVSPPDGFVPKQWQAPGALPLQGAFSSILLANQSNKYPTPIIRLWVVSFRMLSLLKKPS
jgi:hypothetical protein